MSSDTSTSVSFANKGSLYNVSLRYVRDLNEVTLTQADSVLVVGQQKDLRALQLSNLNSVLNQVGVSSQWLSDSVNYVSAEKTDNDTTGTNTGSVSWLNKLVVSKIPDKASRHNTQSRSHEYVGVVRKNVFGQNQLIVATCERQHSVAVAAAIARAFPLYNGKSDANPVRNVYVKLVYTDSQQEQTVDDVNCFNVLAESVRLSARITDTPCMEMHTDAFLEEARKVGRELNIEPYVVEGEELLQRGFGGLYNVGRAAEHPPKLVVLSHTRPEATRTVAWVGKGIVYDTGGLSLKTPTNMVTMKNDCGGAAGILGAFRTAVKLGFRDNLHAVLCLAENAVGPRAQRPDDVIRLYSGKTVEVNNTDAEGRLVLGDGVAYASKDLKADTIVDMATLTGAQGISTGKYHGALLTNDEEWENRSRVLGNVCGDLVFPLVFAPELHFSEFDSEFADMKNSIAKPMASSSCAGLFIHSHLHKDFKGPWIHVDMAYPVTDNQRGTGYGVSLLNTLFGDSSENSLLRDLRTKSN